MIHSEKPLTVNQLNQWIVYTYYYNALSNKHDQKSAYHGQCVAPNCQMFDLWPALKVKQIIIN